MNSCSQCYSVNNCCYVVPLQGDDRVFGITLPPQDYDVLRRKHLASGRLFEDRYFPATDQSMFFSQKPPRKFEWKRPQVSWQQFVHVKLLIVKPSNCSLCGDHDNCLMYTSPIGHLQQSKDVCRRC